MRLHMNEKILLLVLSVATLSTACSGNGREDEGSRMQDPAGSEVCYRLSESEALRYAPTDLFKSIYCNDQELFDEALDRSTFRFNQQNVAEKDTALAVAIKLGRDSMVKSLISRVTLEELKIKNHNDRSFISLLAEYDMIESFDEIVRIFRERRSAARDMLSYGFQNIDFPDKFGRNAAHYALSAAMMDRLRENWSRSALNFNNPWHRFFYQYDNDGNLFLHSAARDQRVYVINWYVDEYCTSNKRRDDESGVLGSLNYLGRQARYAVQDLSVHLNLTKNLGFLVNIPNEKGNTPLHIAARLGNSESVRFLMACSQIDPSIKNDFGRYPITELLTNIDPFQENVHTTFKDTFNLLLERADPIWWGVLRGNNFRKMMSDGESEVNGMTAVHYAARLADPYFFDEIPEFVKQGVLNKYNITAEELRR